MKIHEIESKIWGAAEAAANDWFRRQCKDLHTSMYIYYKPGNINFWIGQEPLSGEWQLADNQRVSIALTKEQVARHIAQIARRLPIL